MEETLIKREKKGFVSEKEGRKVAACSRARTAKGGECGCVGGFIVHRSSYTPSSVLTCAACSLYTIGTSREC